MKAATLPFLNFLSGAVALDKTPALCDDKAERWTSYGDLREKIRELTPIWRAHTIAPPPHRSLVLCAIPRTTSGAIASLSAIQAGHAILFVDPSLPRLNGFIEAYQPEFIITDSSLRPSPLYDIVNWSLKEINLWRCASPSHLELHPDLLFLFCPPGPEGSLKTVRLSYKNIESNLLASIEALHVSPHERAILNLPLSYSFGYAVLCLLLSVGGSVILSEQTIKNRLFWNNAEKREATLLPGIPFHFDYIAKASLDHLGAPRIKTFWQTGGRIPSERQQELLKQITARKGNFYVLYGQTEAAPRMTVLPLHEHPNKIGSSGKVIQGGSLSIENEELIYHGPNVMMGYALGRQDLEKGDEKNGRLETGEIGLIDEEGFLFLSNKQ